MRSSARWAKEEIKGGGFRIVVTEIPYQVNKTALIRTAADLVRTKRIEDIATLRDESDRSGMRIVFELKRGAHPELVLNQLYKYTQLQTTFNVNNLAIVDKSPRVLPLKDTLSLFLDHRAEGVRESCRRERRQQEIERTRTVEEAEIAAEQAYFGAAVVDFHHALPLSKRWGWGALSSSDGQRFRAGGKAD